MQSTTSSMHQRTDDWSSRNKGMGHSGQDCESNSGQTITEYPMTSLLTTFAVGAVIGCAAVVAFQEHRERNTLRGMARQWMDTVSNTMPDQLTSAWSKWYK